jgi:hypothetical protein
MAKRWREPGALLVAKLRCFLEEECTADEAKINRLPLMADFVAKVPKVAAANFSPKNETSDDRDSIWPLIRYENRL